MGDYFDHLSLLGTTKDLLGLPGCPADEEVHQGLSSVQDSEPRSSRVSSGGRLGIGSGQTS